MVGDGGLLFVGGYYVLRNTPGFDLQELDGEKVWPVIVLAIGVAVLVRAWTQLRSDEGSDGRGCPGEPA